MKILNSIVVHDFDSLLFFFAFCFSVSQTISRWIYVGKSSTTTFGRHIMFVNVQIGICILYIGHDIFDCYHRGYLLFNLG